MNENRIADVTWALSSHEGKIEAAAERFKKYGGITTENDDAYCRVLASLYVERYEQNRPYSWLP